MHILSTPLTDWHISQGAKMAPFAGWNMPIQYLGIIQEHEHTRNKASIFDICHMAEFIISGPNAEAALSRAVSTKLSGLAPGKCRYGFLLNEQGGIMDDFITYCLAENEYMLVVNAACQEQDFITLRSRLPESIKCEDISDKMGKIDLQGPSSMEVLAGVLTEDWKNLPYFSFIWSSFAGEKILVSRTGYTGELGYEIYLPSSKVLDFWNALLKNPLVKPAGLGARDTLRLEAGLMLYGQDLDQQHTPAEAGYASMLVSEADYVGKTNAFTEREILTPLTISGRRSARHGHKVLLPDGTEAGVVTSGSYAPSLGHAIAVAYIKKEFSGQPAYIIQADKISFEAKNVGLPFYKNGTARKKLA